MESELLYSPVSQAIILDQPDKEEKMTFFLLNGIFGEVAHLFTENESKQINYNNESDNYYFLQSNQKYYFNLDGINLYFSYLEKNFNGGSFSVVQQKISSDPSYTKLFFFQDDYLIAQLKGALHFFKYQIN